MDNTTDERVQRCWITTSKHWGNECWLVEESQILDYIKPWIDTHIEYIKKRNVENNISPKYSQKQVVAVFVDSFKCENEEVTTIERNIYTTENGYRYLCSWAKCERLW